MTATGEKHFCFRLKYSSTANSCENNVTRKRERHGLSNHFTFLYRLLKDKFAPPQIRHILTPSEVRPFLISGPGRLKGNTPLMQVQCIPYISSRTLAQATLTSVDLYRETCLSSIPLGPTVVGVHMSSVYPPRALRRRCPRRRRQQGILRHLPRSRPCLGPQASRPPVRKTRGTTDRVHLAVLTGSNHSSMYTSICTFALPPSSRNCMDLNTTRKV